MYDFYLGTKEEIEKDEIKFLISIKRMMPRWVNSLPDSEYIALARILDEKGKEARDAGSEPVFVETGAGASSLVMAFYAMKYDGIAYSWDMNGEKGSVIRTVCTETMCNYFGRHIQNHWKLVAASSLSPYLGLRVLGDLVSHLDVFFHDSEHVWTTIRDELEAIFPLLTQEAVVALDDSNLAFRHTNMGYINMFRKKLGLPAAEPPEGNEGAPFHVEAEKLLKERFSVVVPLDDYYKEAFREDPYNSYYNSEMTLNQVSDTLENRFNSWCVSGLIE